MKVLFLTLGSFKTVEEGGIYQDFVKELSKSVDEVVVASPIEPFENINNEIFKKNNITSLRINVGSIKKTSFIKKGINTLLIEIRYKKEILRHFKNTKFDLIIYSTPPMTFSNLIKYFKKRDNSISYLMLKDIFPQNAVDLNIFSKKGVIYNYFRHKEKQTYSITDLIGVMSLANKKYLLNNNNISDGKISIFR